MVWSMMWSDEKGVGMGGNNLKEGMRKGEGVMTKGGEEEGGDNKGGGEEGDDDKGEGEEGGNNKGGGRRRG